MSDFGRRAKAAKKFGVYVLRLREHLGLSQTEFAQRMFCHQTLVSRVESGSVPATAAFAEQMDVVAGAPGVYADRRTELFGATDPELCDHLRESAMSGTQSAELFHRLAEQRECE
ncbi:helix-turn-helix domain-containing protein [Streptomyces sp. CH6]|uniref:helix-turn-helix domain-containing protein n=1 Tax=Streptomyces sp. CH6 TaxID=3420320 RepID=UPI003D001FA3